MDRKEMVKAGTQLVALAEMVDLMKGRGFRQEEIEEISKDNYNKKTLRLASKFLHEIKVARLGKAVILCALMGSVSACTVTGSVDWHGETGKSATIVSKEFVDKPQAINARRY